MKKTLFLIAAIALFGLAFNQTASAQAYSSVTLGVPSILTASTNLATPLVLGPLKQQNVALSATISGTATFTNTYTFQRSVDGVNWDTAAANSYTLQAVTTGAATTTTTNAIIQGFGYLRLYSVTVVGSGTVTNNAINYGLKLVSP